MARDLRRRGTRSQTRAILALLPRTAPSTARICLCVARSSELGVENLKRYFSLNLETWSALACGMVSVKPGFTICELLLTTESPEYLTWLGRGSDTSVQSLGTVL